MVVQTVSPLSRDFLYLSIKLNCSDRIFSKNSMWNVALVSQHVQNSTKKFIEGNARKFTVNFAFFAYADVIKCQENLTISCERAQVTTAHNKKLEGATLRCICCKMIQTC